MESKRESKILESDDEGDKYYENKRRMANKFTDSDVDPELKDLSLDEKEQEKRVEAEWNAKLYGPQRGQIRKAKNPVAQEILDGFSINFMTMKNANTNEVLWESDSWGRDLFERELEAHIPEKILQCRAVSREINFSSVKSMQNFNLEQRIFYQGTCLEEWFFYFGFVIPNSTNNWEQVIEAADPESMLPAEELSGNVTIETTFLDGDMMICKTLVRIFYD